MYTVKQAAQLTGLTEHTIRFYTEKGLVPMLKRDKNKIRLFDENAVNCLITIRYLKSTGMSLEAIKEYIYLCLEGDSTIPKRMGIIQKQKIIAESQVKEAEERLSFLKQKLKMYQEILDNNKQDYMNIIYQDPDSDQDAG